jgi:F-type H+-transporting ATPase subunit delta
MSSLNTTRDMNKYANALLELAEQNNQLDIINKDMLQLKAMFDDIFDNIKNKENYQKYARTFYILSDKKQKQVLENILEEINVSKLCKNFVMLLLHNHKLNVLKILSMNWVDIYNNFLGYKKVEIISVIAISDEQENKIILNLKNSIGDKFYLNKIVDANILGGLIIKIEDKMYDDSISTKLNKITNTLRSVV